MLRKALLTLSMALLLSCEPVLKESTQPGSPSGAAGGVTQVTTPPNPCSGCVLAPTTFTRSDPQVRPSVREFPGDPAASYLLIVQDDGQDGTAVEIKLNGEVVVPVTALRGLAVAEVKTAVTLSATNRLTVLPVGKVGAKVVVWMLAGAEMIGPGGGTVTAPTSGATASVPAGAFSLPVMIQMSMAAATPPQYVPVAPSGHDLLIDFLGQAVTLDPAGSITVALPVDAALVPDGVVDLRTKIREMPGEVLWADAPVVGGEALITMPVAGLAQMEELFGSTSTVISMFPEDLPPMLIGSADAPAGLSGPVACATYPAASPTWPSAGPMRRDPKSSASASTAVVLIHGWDPSIATCGEFASLTLSGERRFDRLLPSLEDSLGSKAQIWVYTYPTFNDFHDSGFDLASRLANLPGVTRIILAGHSMGGLVAREATYELQTNFGRQGLVNGIVTLGTPHEGAARAVLFNAYYWTFGYKRTPGSNSLEAGVSRSFEEAPLYAYVGLLPLCVGASKPIYFFGCLLSGLTGSDGLVGIFSAAPGFETRNTVFGYYDHTEISAGQDGQGSIADPLIASIVATLDTLVGASGGPGTLVYSDDFSGGLGNWVEIDPDGYGSWTTQNGELFGDYNIGCGSPYCNQTQLLLADALQPVNNGYSNWRMEVQSGLVQAYCCFNGGAMANLGKFALYVSNAEKEQFDAGWVWNFGLQPPLSLTTALASHQAYPWTQIGYVTPTVPSWNPHQWQTVILEKVGNQYTTYFKGNSDLSPNGVQMYSVSRTFSGPVKIGFSTYGGVLMDNFKLYRLP